LSDPGKVRDERFQEHEYASGVKLKGSPNTKKRTLTQGTLLGKRFSIKIAKSYLQKKESHEDLKFGRLSIY